jgi:transcription antitermination factor NusG
MREQQGKITGHPAPAAGIYWYALRVRMRYEKAVEAALLSKGYEAFLPVYRKKSRWSDRVKEIELPLFPGYIFSQFDFHHRLPVLTIPGVAYIIGNRNLPSRVAEHELEGVRRFIASGLPVLPCPYLGVGQLVRVKRGALTGVEGMVVESRGLTRLIISVTLLQRSVAVQIERDWVGPSVPSPADLRRVTNQASFSPMVHPRMNGRLQGVPCASDSNTSDLSSSSRAAPR